MSEPIRIVIADDHAIVREGLRALILTERGMQLVGEASDGLEAVQCNHSLHPDVILIDLMMPRMDGLTAIGEIKRQTPGVRILVLTSFAEDEMVFPAIKAGAQGYLLKDSPPAELLKAIRSVHRGDVSLHPAIAARLMRELSQPAELPLTHQPLTHREVDILRLIARGLSNEGIAEQLVLSERTVRTHVSNILAKLHLANRTQAALYALREGLASMDTE